MCTVLLTWSWYHCMGQMVESQKDCERAVHENWSLPGSTSVCSHALLMISGREYSQEKWFQTLRNETYYTRWNICAGHPREHRASQDYKDSKNPSMLWGSIVLFRIVSKCKKSWELETHLLRSQREFLKNINDWGFTCYSVQPTSQPSISI